jgi:hypothetical protein
MGDLASLIADVGPFHWLGLAVVLIGIEMIMPTQYLMWPGIAAAVVGLLGFVFQLPLTVEIGVFGVLSAGLVAAAHYWFPGVSTHAPSRLNQRADQLVGKPAVVQDAFVNGQGAVTLGDTRWAAQSDDGSDLPAGARVTILSADSTMLIVKRLSDPRQ